MDNIILETVLNYLREAGQIALSEQDNPTAQLKADDSYVTNVDLRLSELAFKRLSAVVPESRIVTEEHLENLRVYQEQDDLDSDDEILVFVDPIDGTRNYFHNMPLFGVSVGVFRGTRPWIGAVMFPALDELFFCDETTAYLETGTYGGLRETRPIEPNSPTLNTNSVMLFANSYIRKYRWSYQVCTAMVTACVSLNACWPLVDRGIGTILVDHIWDYAGSWPILQRVGFELRTLETDEKIERYRPDNFNADTLLLKEPVVVARPEHFEAIRQGVTEGAWVS